MQARAWCFAALGAEECRWLRLECIAAQPAVGGWDRPCLVGQSIVGRLLDSWVWVGKSAVGYMYSVVSICVYAVFFFWARSSQYSYWRTHSEDGSTHTTRPRNLRLFGGAAARKQAMQRAGLILCAGLGGGVGARELWERDAYSR